MEKSKQQQKIEAMQDKCISHARTAARHGTMKGLDPNTLGTFLVIEGLMLMFGIDFERAMRLYRLTNAYALEILSRDSVNQLGADGQAILAPLLNENLASAGVLEAAVLADIKADAVKRVEDGRA